MPNEVLTEREAESLFNRVYANREDPEKLNELVGNAGSKEADEVEEVTPGESPEATDSTEQPKETAPPQGNEEPAGEGENPDPLAELDSLKRRYYELEHRVKSDEGRVSAFQRKNRELESKLAALNSTSPTSKPSTQTASSAEDDVSEVEAQRSLDELKKVDPALYKLFVKRDKDHRKEIDSLRGAISTELAPVRDTVATITTEREASRLREFVPNIEEVVRSDAFRYYRDNNAPAIVKTWLSSKYADEVLEGIRAYGLYLQSTAPPATPAASTQTKPQAANAVVSERERKLNTSVSVGSSPAAPVKKEQTEEELFNEVYAQLHDKHRVR